MAYLDIHKSRLTAHTAAHLLRRVTCGPTQKEIQAFTNLEVTDAVKKLFDNVAYTLNPAPPLDYDETKPTAGQPFLDLPYSSERRADWCEYLRFWWVGLMCEQNGRPSVLEKLTAFWQNHFVVSQAVMGDYRMSFQFLKFLRDNCLGDFRYLITEMTKNPGMLIFQNGNLNHKGSPNENYARELQELFVVGENNFAGVKNYTEEDVRAAARVLTGWQVYGFAAVGDFGSTFTPNRHDTQDKVFSSKYQNRVIVGRDGSSAGVDELDELIDMLLNHQESSRFICRKLYRWYVNPEVTQEIEDNVIIPLANFFASPSNNFQIKPVLEKLLLSDIFYDQSNIGAIIKSPMEFVIGMIRHYEHEIPDKTTDYAAFRRLMRFAQYNMAHLGMNLLAQPLVFGLIPYYQTGYSKNWINGNALGIRGVQIDQFVHPFLEMKPGKLIGVDLLAQAVNLQPNFSDVDGTPAITAEQLFDFYVKNLFAIELTQAQKDFLIDTIMMMNLGRGTWIREWNNYRRNPGNNDYRNAAMYRGRLVVRYMLRMAEYYVF